MISSHIMCLSRILFIFPSQYLLTIGFKTLFCFRLQVQSYIANWYHNSRHTVKALNVIEFASSIRHSLTTKDFSKTIDDAILYKCKNHIKQHANIHLCFTWWTYIISFAINWTFNFFVLIRLLICLNLAGMQIATHIIIRRWTDYINHFKQCCIYMY
jgi:hypothetical protein